MEQKQNILTLKNITKTFLNGKIIANNDISLSIKRNEIHSIIGENGSGKSTLMNIVFGLYKADKGQILLNEKNVNMYQSGSSKKYKIGMVHQHFHLIENFNVYENVILGQEKFNDQEVEKEIIELNNEIFNLKKDINQNISTNKLLKGIFRELKLNHKKILKLEAKIEYFKIFKNIPKQNEEEIEKYSTLILKTKNELDKINKKFEDEKKQLLNLKQEGIPSFSKQLSDYFDLDKKSNKIKQNTTGFLGKLNKKEILKKLSLIQEKYDIVLDPFKKIKNLNVGQRQMVEILKVLWNEKDLIVFDEPTSTLSIVEIKSLLKTIKLLKNEGKTIIFISHKLQEVKDISDRISVLRKGILINTHINDNSLSVKNIANEMVGKIVELNYERRENNRKEVLKIKNLSYKNVAGFKALDNISFTIKEGEIFGLAGIEGNGQEEIIKILTNLRQAYKGEVHYRDNLILDKTGYKLSSTQRRKIMSHIPIDRLKHGVVPTKSLNFNSKISDFDTNFFKNYDDNKKWLFDEKLDIVSKINSSVKIALNKIRGDDILKINEIDKISNHLIYKEIKEKIREINKELKLKKVDNILNNEIKELVVDAFNGVEIDSKYENFILNNDIHIVNFLVKKYIFIKKIEIFKKENKVNFLNNIGQYDEKINLFTSKIIEGLNVNGAFNQNIEIRNLSGGNQQKFVIGREIIRDHEILIAGHPTRGLDILSIDHIYKTMIRNAKSRVTTLLYSLEISELVSICDRIAILYKGKIVDIINPKLVSMEKISEMMIGEK